MKNHLKSLFIFFFSLALTACTAGSPLLSSAISSENPTASPAKKTLFPTPSPDRNVTVTSAKSETCTLLNSRDIAGLFSYAEVEQPQHHFDLVNHPIFTDLYAPADEAACTFYAFSHPGSKNYQYLEVDYWIDLPVDETPLAWSLLGSKDLPQFAQIIPQLGDGAFFMDNQLTFEKDRAYITIKITGINLQVDSGLNQALDIETRLAGDMLRHWKS